MSRHFKEVVADCGGGMIRYQLDRIEDYKKTDRTQGPAGSIGVLDLIRVSRPSWTRNPFVPAFVACRNDD